MDKNVSKKRSCLGCLGFIFFIFVVILIIGGLSSHDSKKDTANLSDAEKITQACQKAAGEDTQITVNDDLSGNNDGGKIVLVHFPATTADQFATKSTHTLKAAYQSGANVSEVTTFGEADMTDKKGNTTHMTVAKCNMTQATAKTINWDNFLWENLQSVADEYWVHPGIK